MPFSRRPGCVLPNFTMVFGTSAYYNVLIFLIRRKWPLYFRKIGSPSGPIVQHISQHYSSNYKSVRSNYLLCRMLVKNAYCRMSALQSND